jgi:hypothetical protein
VLWMRREEVATSILERERSTWGSSLVTCGGVIGGCNGVQWRLAVGVKQHLD